MIHPFMSMTTSREEPRQSPATSESMRKSMEYMQGYDAGFKEGKMSIIEILVKNPGMFSMQPVILQINKPPKIGILDRIADFMSGKFDRKTVDNLKE